MKVFSVFSKLSFYVILAIFQSNTKHGEIVIKSKDGLNAGEGKEVYCLKRREFLVMIVNHGHYSLACINEHSQVHLLKLLK